MIVAVSIAIAGCGHTSRSTSPANSANSSALVNELRKLAENQCGAKAEAIDLEVRLQSQGCDDLDLVELVMTIEEKYNLTISDDQTDRATINSLARTINNR